MTAPDSTKILSIARAPEFKGRVLVRLLKFVDYKSGGNDADKQEVMEAARKVWGGNTNMESVCMLILLDPNLLNAAAENQAGKEITDDQISGRLEPNIKAWASVL